MKVALNGGAPVQIADAPDARGGTWNGSGVIVFSPRLIDGGLMRVPENGGAVEPVTQLDVQQGENSHRWPVFLPDGIHFLYFVRSVEPERRGVYVGRIDRPASTPGTPLFRSESEAVYAPSNESERGVLLSAASGRIEARPFDAWRLALTGDPRALDLPSAASTLYHAMMLTVSASVIAHTPASVPYGARLGVIGRDGGDATFRSEHDTQNWPRLSPDGRRLAFSRIDPASGRTDFWIEDLIRGTRVRVAGSPIALLPVWSPDGERLAYVAGTMAKPMLTMTSADGAGPAMPTLPCPGLRCDPTDWSADGRWLLVTVNGERDLDVWLLPASGQGDARPLLDRPFRERDARCSPDGRLLAYVSEETGRPEISVQMVDGAPRREVISVEGGEQPVWSRAGRNLFFVDPQGLLRSAAVSFSPGGRPVFGASTLLEVPRIGSGHWGTQYDVSPDGRRIHFLDRRLAPPPTEFGVVVGWRALLN